MLLQLRILLKKKTGLDISIVSSRCYNCKTSSTSFSRGGGGRDDDDGGVLMSLGDHGALGLGSSSSTSSIMAVGDDTYEPVWIPGLPPHATRIGAAHCHSLAVSAGGEVGAWGRNNGTQLGRGCSHRPRVSLLQSSCAGEAVSNLPFLTKMASHDYILMRQHARYMNNASVTLKVDNDVVRFSFDKFQPDNKVGQSNGKKMHKRVKMSKKAKVNELRLYRLKAKKKITSPNPEVRIRYKLEKAKRKETWLIEKLRKFEVRKLPVETYDPEILTEEEMFYLKRTGEKKKNYVPVGRRGVFGGVVLNMHLHWKKHETVKVICKPCKPGQVHEYAEELSRLSKGIVIDIKANNTIIFYRGKNYVRPEVMSPPDTLSKNKALEKYQYEQSLEHTSLFIEKLEKELEEYHKHIALYRKRKEAASEQHSTTKLQISDGDIVSRTGS